MAERKWQQLPEDILYDVAMRLCNLRNLFVYGSVCKSWHSALAPIIKSPPPLPLGIPMLMLARDHHHHHQAEKKNKKEKQQTKRNCDCGGGLFSLLDGQTYRPTRLNKGMIRSCVGISHGWLMVTDPELEVHMAHPLTGHKIELPPLHSCPNSTQPREDFDQFFVRKAVVTDAPWKDGAVNPNCAVFAIIGLESSLWTCRLGEVIIADSSSNAAWTEVQPIPGYHSDIVYYKGKIYSVSQNGALYQINIDTNNIQELRKGSRTNKASITNYLVASVSGDLLLVKRYHGGFYHSNVGDEWDDVDLESKYVTVGFMVTKLVGRKLERLYDLRDDEVLFLGPSSSLSLSLEGMNTKRHGGGRGLLTPNCIYFTDDNIEFFSEEVGGGHDHGVFNMVDDTVKKCYPEKIALSKHCPPFGYI